MFCCSGGEIVCVELLKPHPPVWQLFVPLFFEFVKEKNFDSEKPKWVNVLFSNSTVRRHPPAHRRPLRTRWGGEDPHLRILQLGPAKQGKENTISPQKNTIYCIVYNCVIAVPRKRGGFVIWLTNVGVVKCISKSSISRGEKNSSYYYISNFPPEIFKPIPTFPFFLMDKLSQIIEIGGGRREMEVRWVEMLFPLPTHFRLSDIFLREKKSVPRSEVFEKKSQENSLAHRFFGHFFSSRIRRFVFPWNRKISPTHTNKVICPRVQSKKRGKTWLGPIFLNSGFLSIPKKSRKKYIFLFLDFLFSLCVCVCVCEIERREKGRKKEEEERGGCNQAVTAEEN